MNLIDINESQIKALSKVSLNLTHFWLLHLLSGVDTVVYIPQIRERKLLEDRGLISKKGILPAGEAFYKQICDTKLETPVSKKVKEEAIDNGFSEFWNSYPASANFSYRGMTFKSERALRSNKQVCEMLYNAAISKGEVTKEQILAALKYQVREAKEASFKTGTNKLQFFPGVEPYLRQEKYMAFIEVATEHSDEQPSDSCWA
jgi:hypothetical protein